MATPHPRLRGRPAHAPGPTYLAYTPDGRRLITVGSNNAIRVYTTGSDGEPKTVDDCQESNTAVAATNGFFVSGSEDGMVTMYSLKTFVLDQILTRCTMPIRDVAISPDGAWCAVASDELTVKFVDTRDMTHILMLREQSKPVKHLSFDVTGKLLAVSCSDGVVYIYSVSTDAPQLTKKIDGLIRSLETNTEASSLVAWHPDGRALAAATATRDIQVVSTRDWTNQKKFSNGHAGDITALAWSYNGAILATAGSDRKILLWESKSQSIIARYDYPNVMDLAWHPTENILSFTNTEGEVYIFSSAVPSSHTSLLEITLQPAPFLSEAPTSNAAPPLDPTSGQPDLETTTHAFRMRRPPPSVDSLDEILDGDGDDQAFVSDDDGAGYLQVNGNGKRTNGHVSGREGGDDRGGKRRAYGGDWQPQVHGSFQPGSTPWRGSRRYLCLNLVGCIWTVDQETHHTVTVEFYDRDLQRDFHFTDPWMYDTACLNETGSLYSCPSKDSTPAQIFYRPHETWTARADWRISLPMGEEITALALSSTHITAQTTLYTRLYTLHGLPLAVVRPSHSPAITCASHGPQTLTLANGPLLPSGTPQITFTLTSLSPSDPSSSGPVPLPPTRGLKSVFFSDAGDPFIYDSSGVLLVLTNWRRGDNASAQWTPLLDTKRLLRLSEGRREESYWPVAVARNRFICIILKGGEKDPHFPRPLLSEFEFEVPLAAKTEEPSERAALEGKFALGQVLGLLGGEEDPSWEGERDKLLLRLVAEEAREGEERGTRALELVGLMTDRAGVMMDAAGKVAERFGRTMLREKIRELAEQRAEERAEGDDMLD